MFTGEYGLGDIEVEKFADWISHKTEHFPNLDRYIQSDWASFEPPPILEAFTPVHQIYLPPSRRDRLKYCSFPIQIQTNFNLGDYWNLPKFKFDKSIELLNELYGSTEFDLVEYDNDQDIMHVIQNDEMFSDDYFEEHHEEEDEEEY
jgi:hypothetical protein